MPEIAFAAVGLTVRLDTLQGEIQTAKEVLSSFEKSVREQGAVQLLPNIAALRCRLALREGDKRAVEGWMEEAPGENREFCIKDCQKVGVVCFSAAWQKFSNADIWASGIKSIISSFVRVCFQSISVYPCG